MWIKATIITFMISLIASCMLFYMHIRATNDNRFQELHDEIVIRTCPHEHCGWDENEGGTWIICCRCNMHVKATCATVKDGRIYVHPHQVYGVTYAYIPHE